MSAPHTPSTHSVHLPDPAPNIVRSLDPHRPEVLSDSSPNPHAPLSNSFVPRVKAVSWTFIFCERNLADAQPAHHSAMQLPGASSSILPWHVVTIGVWDA